MSRWFEIATLVGFVDGTWKSYDNGSIVTGIGRFIIDKMGSIRYTFSGPSKASSPEEAEMHALSFIA